MARTVNNYSPNVETEPAQVDATQTTQPLAEPNVAPSRASAGRGKRHDGAARHQSARAKRSLYRHRRGAVAAEYAMLLTFVAVPTVLGILAGAATMLSNYNTARAALLAPNP